MKAHTINKLLNKKTMTFNTGDGGLRMTGEGVLRTTGEGVNVVVSPLAEEQDPRVKKLKRELEKLDVNPKPKYIYFNFQNKKK